jgi:hypothetical protein
MSIQSVERKLNKRQEIFVNEYLKNGNNAAAAARAAGYCKNSPHTAKTRGCELLKNPCVAQAIGAGKTNLAISTNYDMAAAIRELDDKIRGAEAAKNWNAVSNLMRTKLQATGNLTNADPRVAAGFQIRIVGVDDTPTKEIQAVFTQPAIGDNEDE